MEFLFAVDQLLHLLVLVLVVVVQGRGLRRLRPKQSWPHHRHGSDSNRAKGRIRQTTNPEEATAFQTARDIDAALDLAKASDKWPCSRTSTRSAARTGKIGRQFLRENRSDCRFSERRYCRFEKVPAKIEPFDGVLHVLSAERNAICGCDLGATLVLQGI